MLTINPSRSLRNRRNSRRRNPCGCGVSTNPGALGWAGIVGATALALGGGYWLYSELTNPPKPLPTPGPGPYIDPAPALADVISMGATLNEAPFVVGDILQPIALRRSDVTNVHDDFLPVAELAVNTGMPTNLNYAAFGVSNVDPTEVESAGEDLNDSAISGGAVTGQKFEAIVPGKAIGALVTNVSADFARFVYESWLVELVERKDVEFDLELMDSIIIDILQTAAPGVDWSQGLQPFVFGDAAYTVWVATQLIGMVAGQSAFEKGLLD